MGKNLYEILAINSSATAVEIRRAYRTLARRYHPDVNPGKDSTDRFKAIAKAYEVLSDPEQRKQYDIQLEIQQRRSLSSKYKAYAEQQARSAQERYFRAQQKDYEAIKKFQQSRPGRLSPQNNAPPTHGIQRGRHTHTKPNTLDTPTTKAFNSATNILGWLTNKLRPNKHKDGSPTSVNHISIVELSISMEEALAGVRKTVTFGENDALRKLKALIPPGTRDGSLLRFRSTGRGVGEEVVLVVRVARHPFLKLEQKGVILEIPITINEAITGATIEIPTLTVPTTIKIPPNTQSGTDLRLREQGLPLKEGRGDLFVRLLIAVPESIHAVGLKEKAAELDLYYESPVRQHLPKTLPGN